MFWKHPTWKTKRLISGIKSGGNTPTNIELGYYTTGMRNILSHPLSMVWNDVLRYAYRYYFGTVRFLDWATVCEQRLISVQTLRTIAKHDFHLKNIELMSYDKICEGIIYTAIEDRAKYHKVLGNIVQHQQNILWKPGGLKLISNIHSKRWRNEMIIKRKQILEPKLPILKQVSSTKQILANICKKPNQIDRFQLLDMVWSLGLRGFLPVNIINISPAQLCKLIQEHIKLTTKRPFLPLEMESKLDEPITPLISPLSPMSPFSPLSLESPHEKT